MKFSVVTACFNSAKTIQRTIDSVAGQTHRNIEHIVVDGGSTDGTLNVLEKNRHCVHKLIPGPDLGIYDALNKGLTACTGDVVSFLHSDDTYARENVLEVVAGHFEVHRLDAVYGDIVFVRPDRPDKVVRTYSSRRFKPSRLSWGWMPAHPALFLRQKVFERYGGFNTTYRIAGDYEFIARVFSSPEFRSQYLPQVLVKMGLGGISTKSWRNTLLLNKEVLRACRENGISTNYLKILSKYPLKLTEFFARRRGMRTPGTTDT